MFQQQHGVQSLLKDGGKHFAGVDEALIKNIEACRDLSKIVQSSFGPNGTNKLVINHLGKQFVTSDTATMLKEMEVAHPCGKLLVQASTAQEFESGDSTNFTVMLAGSLLAEAETLLKEGLHSSDILRGYELALNKVVEIFEKAEKGADEEDGAGGLTAWKITKEELKDPVKVAYAVKSAIASKQQGLEDPLAQLVANAVVQITSSNSAVDTKGSIAPSTVSNRSGEDGSQRAFDIDSLRTCKIPGGALSKSFVVEGMVIPRDTMGVEKSKEKAKVVVYGQGIEFQQTEAKGTVLLENAEQLMNFSKGEESNMEEWIKGLADMGISVVISGGAIAEIAQHFLDKYKILVVKIGSKFELRRMCKTLRAISILRSGPPLPEEIGYVDSVKVEEIASQRVTIFRTEESRISTIVLRGATASVLDEWERSINDAVHCIRVVAQDIRRSETNGTGGVSRFLAGAGSTEIELARRVQEFGATVSGLEQYAVIKFSEALEVVPKILADNCGKMGRVETLSALYAAHKESKGISYTGLNVDLETPEILLDAKKEGILDHLSTKKWAVKHALEAVLTVLRVDHIIMSKQAGGPKA